MKHSSIRGILFRFVELFCLSHILVSCSSEPNEIGEIRSDMPVLFPDYCGVTIPVHIAPLNFKVPGAKSVRLSVSLDGHRELELRGDSVIRFPESEWKELLEKARGKALRWHLAVWENKERPGVEYQPFTVWVAREDIDPCIAYRLIPPGYELWNKMGIYQRELSSFRETAIVENTQNQGGCVNCHSFCQYDAGTFMFHARGKNGGTVISRNGYLQKVDLASLPPNKNGTYPMWHPSGNYIVFSSNTTRQSFYGYSRDKIEVYDLESDLMVYDVKNNRLITDNRFLTENEWETFPAFSPDGKFIYYCVASRQELPTNYDKLKYALCRVPFNEQRGAFGSEEVDTLYSPAKRGGSVSFPRLSPDGKYLMYTEAACATFPIHHKEADLKMIRLADGLEMDTSPLNSGDVDSYHAWSSNGHWVIFSSKRMDSRYTRLFLAYMDNAGRFAKPFMLPQEEPEQNMERLYAYNIPEFINGKVMLSKDEVASLFR